MSSKLTLYIDENLITYVKRYAKENNLSVSKVVNNFLTLLKNEPDPNQYKKHQNTPITDMLKGALKGKEIDITDYHKHLEEKYL